MAVHSVFRGTTDCQLKRDYHREGNPKTAWKVNGEQTESVRVLLKALDKIRGEFLVLEKQYIFDYSTLLAKHNYREDKAEMEKLLVETYIILRKF